MKIIIIDIDTGEEEIITLKAPRKEQCLSNEEIRGRREFAIDAVILEGLKFMGTHRYIASPNSRQNLEMYPILSASECEAINRNIREETQAISEALFHPPHPVIEEITEEEATDVWNNRGTNPARDLIRLQDSFETLSTPCLRTAIAHQLYRDGIDNAAGILATLFNDPSPSCIEDPDNPFPED